MRVRLIAVLVLAISVAACSPDDEESSSSSSAPPATVPTPASTAPASPAPPPAVTTAVASPPTTSAEAVSAPSIASMPCPPEYPATARCSVLTVLADRADPASGIVELPVTVLPATGPDPAAAPIVIPAGGPGFPGADDLGWAGSPWNERRDIVLYDQRGTGGAVPALECPAIDAAFVAALQSAAPYVQERDAMATALASCVADAMASGIDLTDYNSEASAADLAELRVALGYEQWNLFGLSYGGRLALATMRSHPEGIRAVVLDSVYDVTYGGLADRVAGIEQAFDRLVEGCAAASTCAANSGDLAATIEQTRQRYNATPVMLDADLGDGSGPRPFVVTGDDMMAGLFNALYDAELIPLLPGLVNDLNGGDTSVIPTLLERGVRFATGYADTMALAVNCADDAGLGTQAADDATFEEPGRLGLVVAQTGRCPDGWPATPGAFNEPVTSEIPAVVFAGSYDPITPPDGTRAVAERLGQATFVLVEPAGHGAADLDDCTRSIALTFLDDPTRPPDTSCVAAIPPAFG